MDHHLLPHLTKVNNTFKNYLLLLRVSTDTRIEITRVKEYMVIWWIPLKPETPPLEKTCWMPGLLGTLLISAVQVQRHSSRSAWSAQPRTASTS